MKKILAVLLAVCMLVMLVCGCSGKKTEEDSQQGGDKAGKLKIGLSVMDLSNSYFAEFANGAQKYADENGIDLIINDPQSDTQKQVSAIENFISSGCDAIVVSALDAESSRGAIADVIDTKCACWLCYFCSVCVGRGLLFGVDDIL